MRPHIMDAPRAPSTMRLAAYLKLARKWPTEPSRTVQFRKAGQTVRSMRLRQYLRIARTELS